MNEPIMRWMSPKQLTGLMRWQFGIPAEFVPTFEADLCVIPPEALTRFLLASYSAIETPTLTTSPVLVTVGQQETPTAKAMAKQLVKNIPGARGAAIPGLGHVWNLQNPTLFNAVLIEWLVNGQVAEGVKAF